MSKLIKNPLIPFENKWVALTQDRKEVLASGSSVKEVDKKLERAKLKEQPVLLRVLPFDKTYSP